MRECRTYGSVRGVRSNAHSYRNSGRFRDSGSARFKGHFKHHRDIFCQRPGPSGVGRPEHRVSPPWMPGEPVLAISWAKGGKGDEPDGFG